MLPSGFAPWELVYYYYRKWSSLGEFDLLLNNLRETVRLKMGQKAEASLGIMDSQSVRWGDNRSLNGIDGNKKVKGVKRHVLVDLKSASNLNGNLNCSKELEHYAS